MPQVLIVDDSKAARMMLSHWLRAARPGCRVLEAGNAEEALNVSRGLSEKAVVVVDYNMPGENGIVLAEQLMPRFSARRIFLVTANIQEAVRTRAEGLGLGYIPKPLNPKKITAIIDVLESTG